MCVGESVAVCPSEGFDDGSGVRVGDDSICVIVGGGVRVFIVLLIVSIVVVEEQLTMNVIKNI
jgi:hypothetical protein